MHIASIRSAIDVDDTEAIERAFRLLAEFPHAGLIEGVDSIESLTETLDRVVDRLSGDRAIMPSRTLQAIARAEPKALAEGASYDEGARVVAAHRRHWHAIFLMHVALEPRADRRARPIRNPKAASVTFEMSPDLTNGLDAFIAAQVEAGLSRPEATRVILHHALAQLGFLDPAAERSSPTPEVHGD